MNKDFPILFSKEEECCGCTACFSICHTNAIDMQEDEKGFLYPIIDKSKCVKCHACLKICPLKEQNV